ncbi:TonB-dependent receptor [Brevundimonas staleyi]|uniref:TonB-dependent receptor n=1 Tax=Brevundimonas staleyi TaxID=74326 RepID=A0ABW0FN67_9CAUL
MRKAVTMAGVSALAILMLPNLASAQTAGAQSTAVDDIIVTAQRREVAAQDTAVSLSAVSGDTLERAGILNFQALSGSVPSFSLTNQGVLDQELNIRGVSNTRLDAPTSDQSIGVFLDDVFVGRSGLINTDFFDIGRIEVIRGPQGVLLGRNVVGGALSVYPNEPTWSPDAMIKAGYGNYDSVLLAGHVNGALSERLAGRIAFQYRDHSGYNRDVLNNRDLDDLTSTQVRAQLKYDGGERFTARLALDYTDDRSNGQHRVAIDEPTVAGTGPWSATRAAFAAFRGGLDVREGIPEHLTFLGASRPNEQRVLREAFGAALKLDFQITDTLQLVSVTGYRAGEGEQVYHQSGAGPNSPVGVVVPLAFSFPIQENEDLKQVSQELRLVSDYGPDSRLDWILGGYFYRDDVWKLDHWQSETAQALPTLSGEQTFDNDGYTQSYAVFGQVGYRFTDHLKLTAGVRYSHDEKGGVITAFLINGGDRFRPNDLVGISPLDSSIRPGGGYTADYGASWSEVTPQATLEYTPSDDILIYATIAKGYKGGGFEDTPANPAGARFAYDPETVVNYEVGAKIDFLDRRARFNAALFYMDYKNLQVAQQIAACLCNVTDNASDATIKGIEVEALYLPTDWLRLWANGSVLETEYVDFIDSTGVNYSGRELQRTPHEKFSVGAEGTWDLGSQSDALSARIEYTWQSDMSWQPASTSREDSYGLLNGRVSYDLPMGDATVSVWGRNLTDELYRVNATYYFGDNVSILGEPRTWGVELTKRF